jgi:Na+/proline symporter
MTNQGHDSTIIVWAVVFLALYWAFCLFWGVRGARRAATAADFFVAGRDLPVWPFVTAVTATSFAGWFFIGLPGLVLRDGLPAGYAAFAAVVMPLVAALVFKRQWMLGKRFGFVTPGEMLASYLQSDVTRVASVLIAILFAIPFAGLWFGIAGRLLAQVTGDWLTRDAAMWVIAVVPVIFVTLGGVRAVAYVGTLQAILIAAGTMILGLAALDLVGGFTALNEGLARVAGQTAGRWATTAGHGGGDYNALFAVPGVIQWTDGLGRETPVGGPWTAVMILTFVLAWAGIQLSPAFSIWAFASRSPRAFAPQQVWASAAVVGFLLFGFAMLQGVTALLADAAADQVLPALGAGRPDALTGAYIALIGAAAPWLGGVLTVGALVATTAGCAVFLTAAGTTVTRDLYVRFFDRSAGDRLQKQFGRIVMLIVMVLALLMATFTQHGMALLGGLALSLAVQFLPGLLAVTWLPWLTRRGVDAGLIVGAVVAVLTDAIGPAIAGGSLPWGQWPWTIHAAVWGLAANVVVTAIGSAMTQVPAETAHRAAFHTFLAQHGRAAPRRRWLVSAAWIATIAWLFFAIGPGVVIGNDLFGAPSAGAGAWDLAMPSTWAWQLLWWGLGVLLVWFLAYKMELSTAPTKEVVPMVDDVAVARHAGMAPNP